MTEVGELAKLLLGCYRTGDANDPAIYSGAVIAVLSDYPLDIIRAVVDPRSGLPSRSKWLPTVAEIKEACETLHRPRRDAIDREARERRQLAERDTLAIDGPREARPSYQDLVDRCAADGLHIGPRAKAAVSAEAVRDKLGLSKEQWDAIPNAKAGA